MGANVNLRAAARGANRGARRRDLEAAGRRLLRDPDLGLRNAELGAARCRIWIGRDAESDGALALAVRRRGDLEPPGRGRSRPLALARDGNRDGPAAAFRSEGL